MLICGGYPPNIDEILAVFPAVARMRGILFAWDDRIFNPSGITVPASLIAHEEVHSRQQSGQPDAWWKSYLTDPRFRLSQEIEAHVAEFKAVCLYANRATRRAALAQIASRLSGPLYGRMISSHEARRKLETV